IGVGDASLSARVEYLGMEKQAVFELSIGELTSDKTRGTIYTEEKVSNARSNVLKYNWAKSYLDNSISLADGYVDMGWDYLWNLVPPQNLPRSYAVNQPLGSPVSGDQIDQYGNYPY